MMLADTYKVLPDMDPLSATIREEVRKAVDSTTTQIDAARLLGISPRKLSYLLVHKYKLQEPKRRNGSNGTVNR